MNKKGFTLIELLAVIVILAIIALIATPIILNVIDTAKKGAKESSTLGYIDAVEKQVMLAQVDTAATNIAQGTYTVAQLEALGVKIKGEAPKNDSVITIGEKGQVTNAWVTYEESEYKVYYDGKKAVADKTDYLDDKGVAHNTIATPGTSSVKTYTVGEAIYLDPTNLSATCNASNSTVGSGTSGCMKFYVIKDNGSSVNAILDHNTANGVVWNSSNSNVAYESSGVYTSVQSLVTNGWPSSTRLITVDEVNAITGKTGFDSTSTSSWYYLDSLNQTQTATSQGASNYAWLFDYTNSCTSSGCNVATSGTGDYGYWTQDTIGIAGSGSYVWRVNRRGILDGNSAKDSDRGVRPVISVSKSQIS